MKTTEVIKKLEGNKDFMKNLKKLSYYSIEQFINDANCYIKAIREGRMINSIGRISNSGMSRTIKFLSCEKNVTRKCYQYRQYFCLFSALGFSPINDSDYFRVNGCGMDMIFHTNYTIIHTLERMGFILKADCDKLAQMTPTTI